MKGQTKRKIEYWHPHIVKNEDSNSSLESIYKKVVAKSSNKNIIMKNWFKSKTIWFGVITILIGILQYVQNSWEAGTAITIWGIITILLRILTTQPVVKQD